MWISIAYTIYGTESCLAPQKLELINIMSMCTKDPSEGMLRPSHPIGMHIEQQNIFGILREHHHLRMHTEHYRTHIGTEIHFPLRPDEVQ